MIVPYPRIELLSQPLETRGDIKFEINEDLIRI